MNLERLRETTRQFAEYTEAMLVAAEQGQWEDFLLVHEAREAQMATLQAEAGDALLTLLPELRPMLEAALLLNQRLELLASARRDELGEELSTVQQQRRLRMTYR